MALWEIMEIKCSWKPKALSKTFDCLTYKFFKAALYAYYLCAAAVVHICSLKQVFLKVSQISQENTCVAVSFLIKLQTTFFVSLCKKSPYSVLFWSTFFPHFPTFGLNTDIYSVFLRIQSECRKMWYKCGPE